MPNKGKIAGKKGPRKAKGKKPVSRPRYQNKRDQDVDTAPKSKVILLPQEDGSVGKVTQAQLTQMRMLGKELPEAYVNLAKPKPVIFTNTPGNGGVRFLWEHHWEADFAARIAAFSAMPPPFGAAMCKFYCWHWWFTELRKPTLNSIQPGATGNPSQFGPDALVDFPEDSCVIPVSFAKMASYTFPWMAPNGSKYEWNCAWDQFFDIAGLTTTIPPFTGPSVHTNAGPTDIWNRSVFGNSYLTMKTALAANEEFLWMIDPNSVGAPTIPFVMAQYSEISTWYSNTGSCVEAAKIGRNRLGKHCAPDGSFYAFVNAASNASINNTFPAIYANHAAFDPEIAYLLHQPVDAVDNRVVSTTFSVVKDLPSVLFTDIPTNITAFAAQAAMIINYAFLARQCTWVPGGRKMLLKTIHTRYPTLRSFKPNYYSVNFTMFAQILEKSLDQIGKATSGNNTTILQSMQTYISAGLSFYAAMVTHATQFAYPGYIFYSNSDLSSNTAVSESFLNQELPPIIVDIITGLSPVVDQGQLKIGIFDVRPAAELLFGSKFWGLLPTTDPTTARWLHLANPDNAVDVPGNIIYPSMYVPTTAIASAGAPPTSLDRRQIYAFGLITTGNTPLIWEGVTISRTLILGGRTSPIVPANTSAYAGQTPIRFASQLLEITQVLICNVNSTFNSVPRIDLGLFANINPVVIRNTPMIPNDPIQVVAGSSLSSMIVTMPQMVGSAFSLDQGSVGRSAVFAYRTADNLILMHYSIGLRSNSDPVTAIVTQCIRANGTNSWTAAMIAKSGKGLTPLQVSRSISEQYYQSVAGWSNFAPLHMGKAMLTIKKQLAHTYFAPYHQGNGISTTSFNSPNLFAKMGLEAFMGGPGHTITNKRYPFITPAADLLNDFWKLLT